MTTPLDRLIALRNHITPPQQLLASQPCIAPVLGHNPTGPADIVAERAAASFDVEKMKWLWVSGKENYDVMQLAYQIIQRDPELTTPHFFDLTRPETREFTMRQIRRAIQLRNSIKDEKLKDALFQCLAIYSESFSMRIYVHDLLFKQALTLFGSKEQRAQWTEDIEKCYVLGCFAMTELGHSSFLRGLETTATYDKEHDEFVIHSPTLKSTKWWIGMAGETATHTVAICQTIVDGKSHGINWFIVPLRSLTTGHLLPGVTAGDIGAKFGRNGLDNGWIQFSHVRIPRTNMLSKWVNVDKSGKFHPAPNPAIMYATLIPERLSIMGGTWVLAGQAVTIAARYGVVRRQGAENQKIMDYQSHYTKLMPCVAFMYVSNITNRLLLSQWADVANLAETDIEGYLRVIGDMHAVSAGIKATVTWFGAEVLERCRRACGGHAYSSYNAISGIIGDWGVMTTGAGDNIVLIQQTGRYLLGAIRDVGQGRQASGSATYLNNTAALLERSNCGLDDERDWLKIEAVIGVLEWLVAKRLQTTALALASSASWNDHLLSIAHTAELHCYRHLLHLYVTGVRDSPAELRATLQTMGSLYALHIVEGTLSLFLEEEYLSPKQARTVREVYIRVCKEVRQDVIPLTDAWGFPDFVLKAPIGRADGNIYAAYMETLRAAPNCFGPPKYFEEQIRPLTDPSLNGKNQA